jgi:hypothetical protein
MPILTTSTPFPTVVFCSESSARMLDALTFLGSCALFRSGHNKAPQVHARTAQTTA